MKNYRTFAAAVILLLFANTAFADPQALVSNCRVWTKTQQWREIVGLKFSKYDRWSNVSNVRFDRPIVTSQALLHACIKSVPTIYRSQCEGAVRDLLCAEDDANYQYEGKSTFAANDKSFCLIKDNELTDSSEDGETQFHWHSPGVRAESLKITCAEAEPFDPGAQGPNYNSKFSVVLNRTISQ